MKIKDIKPNKANPRKITDAKLQKLKKSIKEFPAMMELRPIVIAKDGTVLGGNMRLKALEALGYKDIPDAWVKVADKLTDEEAKRFIIEDNVGFGEWDFEMLSDCFDVNELSDWGLDLDEKFEDFSGNENEDENEDDEYEAKKREFQERIERGELSEDDEDYQEFLNKFKTKKTTDDCYTPELVYEAVADYVEKKYNLNKNDFVRPFYPGGDYINENYAKKCVVVDNPPFSILSEIIRFYNDKNIKFFLFAPHLTIFSSSTSVCTAIPVGVPVTYQNGAVVNTSFLTNLEPDIIAKSEPTLYSAVLEANMKNLELNKKRLPKYSYDEHVITAVLFSPLSRCGVDFSVKIKNACFIRGLDEQKEYKKSIFGGGLLVGDDVVKEKIRALNERLEREKREKERGREEKEYVWNLSEREMKIIKKLNENE